MKILYPIEGTGGGAVTHVLSLAQHLPKLEIQPLLVFFLNGPSVNKARDLGLEHRLVPWRFSLDFLTILSLRRIMQEECLNMIHTHTITGSFYCHMANLLLPKRLLFLTTVHSFIIDELKGTTGVTLRDWLRYKRDLFLRRFVDHFIVVSDKLQDRLLDDGVSRDKVELIRHGISVTNDDGYCEEKISRIRRELNIGQARTIVGTVGRLVEVKNHELFLLAARKVLAMMPDTAFVIVGDGPLKQPLEALAEDLGVRDSVLFTGWRNDVVNYLKIFDIYVSCSVTESQGLAILEAMAFSKPVIATNVDEISQTVVDGKTGLLIPPYDLNALTNGILRLAFDRPLREKLGREARRLVECQYSLDVMIKETARLYHKLYQEKYGA